MTSDISGAGTDANVFLIMTGEDGSDTGKIMLDKKGRNDFERASKDEFMVRAGVASNKEGPCGAGVFLKRPSHGV